MRLALTALLTFAVVSCATYRDELVRSQKAFDANDHDRTMALLRDLETDFTRLPAPQQAQYAYLRGMTDYRIGHRGDARHWLALARSYDEASPGTLPADWKQRTNEAIEEMNGVVFVEGTQALAVKKPQDDVPVAKKRKSE
jgi:hypothetical protein